MGSPMRLLDRDPDYNGCGIPIIASQTELHKAWAKLTTWTTGGTGTYTMPPSIFPLGNFEGQEESLTCTHAEEHAPVRVVHLHEPVAGGVNKPVINKIICFTNFPVTIQNERSPHYWKLWGTTPVPKLNRPTVYIPTTRVSRKICSFPDSNFAISVIKELKSREI